MTWPWAGGRAGAAHRRRRLRARRPGCDRRPPGSTDGLPGAPARERWVERIASRDGDAARRGSATPIGGCPIISITGTNGKTTTTRLLTRILLRAGHHVGTTTSDGIVVDERWSSRATGPAPGAPRRSSGATTSTSRSSRPPAAGSCFGASATSRTRRASSRTSVRPPRPPGHPHAARARRGQGDDLPDHEARRLGDPERRRSGTSRRSARTVKAQVAFFTLEGDRSAPVRRHLAPRRAGLPRPRRRDRRGRGRRRDASWRPIAAVREIPIALAGSRATTSRMRSPRPPARGRSARRSSRCATASSTSVPSSDESPGRLNIFRDGDRVAIVDFAHNEAGVAVLLDVVEAIASGAGGRGRRSP